MSRIVHILIIFINYQHTDIYCLYIDYLDELPIQIYKKETYFTYTFYINFDFSRFVNLKHYYIMWLS